jgi:UTP-glucose-1-phosphate uridylyltransferase
MTRIVGVIPAAGTAERMDGLPKYLLPIRKSYLLQTLCERMNACGASDLLIGANPNNSSLVQRYLPANGIVYTKFSETMSETVLAAQPWADKANVLFGMPDSWWEGDDFAYRWLVEGLTEEIPVCVAVFKARPAQKGKLGMVMTQGKFVNGLGEQILEVVAVKDKASTSAYTEAWGAMAWSPKFWQYIRPADPHVGYALERAISMGVTVRAIKMTGNYWDCGTKDEYFELIRSFQWQHE